MIIVPIALLPVIYGCASVRVAGTAPGHVVVEEQYGVVAIPPGHLPPPGECRIWYPGEPPGQQPPPGPCSELEWRVPLGAWLVHGPSEHYEDFVVEVYHEQQPRVVISIRYFDSESGRFLREEKVRRGK
ncbi:MAG: hypothetical protein C4532_00840 [Candidatus Abyssobacteria bacterium SURF_17]|uniref:Lipoprotein n=1 Tax=Candidatus Abyssobacteria bacterium SURF_17 TaxID=2093361 RepID=A0A419F923_9BACT|nr:MAG: hypothetical protein C4532_00840 [Candidatus Abyssubacteria bacterium SURF_17]